MATRQRLTQPRIRRLQHPFDPAVIEGIASVLGSGALVILPTDTVYGVAADPHMPAAVDAIYRAKGRDRAKPLPLLAAGIRDVEQFGAVLGDAERRLAKRFWPGALTLVLRVGEGAEGFRVPDYELTRLILRAAGGVLRATSANRSGGADPLTADAAVAELGYAVAEVVDGGPARGGTPSTVARVVGQDIEILREGALPARVLMAALAEENG